MQFVIIARDGTDPEAPTRRQAVRPAHLEGIRRFVERGNILIGGAILDEVGNMVGSVLVADFPTREELDAWLTGTHTSPTASGRRSRYSCTGPQWVHGSIPTSWFVLARHGENRRRLSACRRRATRRRGSPGRPTSAPRSRLDRLSAARGAARGPPPPRRPVAPTRG